jgi:segregation and condensation protein A
MSARALRRRPQEAMPAAEAFDTGDVEADEAFAVDLDGYEGPLHLLLDLARRQKVDLRRVSLLALADQYLAFIRAARRCRMDLAADYLLMAAWLAWMKSRLLLPVRDAASEDEPDGEAMAQALAARLQRLEAVREAARALMQQPRLGVDVFVRGAPECPQVLNSVRYDTSLYELMHAFGAVRERKRREAPHTVEKQPVLPLETAREGLKAIAPGLRDWQTLLAVSGRIGGAELPARSRLASTFSASLELARDGDVELRQEAAMRPLWLRAAVRGEAG